MTVPGTGVPGPRAMAHAREAAPGRVNLIGEHTDYNQGFVLPMPIPQRTAVEIWPRQDLMVNIQSDDPGYEGASYELLREAPTHTWIDYVQGVTYVLGARGHVLSGFDARVTSDVPIGAGLSSSAALEVALLRALRKGFDLVIDDLEIAQVGQAAEVEFVGVPVGLMDQLASSLGRQGAALLIDTRTLDIRDVEIPEDLAVVVIASGVVHAHGTGQYRRRREECERAAQALGVRSLRDSTLADLSALTEPLLARRARHVITENERVLAMVDALAKDDRPQIRALLFASHASMRDDFEVSVPAVDTLVRIAAASPSVVGARLTGGGFGGAVVMLAERHGARAAARAIAATYAAETGLTPTILLPVSDGEDGNDG